MQCERWFKQKGIKTLHIESSPAIQPFYLEHRYSEMAFNDPANNTSAPQDISLGKWL